MIKRYVTLLPFLSSLLFALAFSRYQAGWVGMIALLPLLEFWQRALKQKWPAKKIILATWLSGLVAMSLTLLWLLDTNPTSWATIKGPSATIGLLFSWGLMSVGLSTGWLLLGATITYFKPWPSSKYAWLLLPGIWLICEYLRSWAFSIIAVGPDASLGAHWNFGHLGFAASSTPLAYLGRLAGLYGLSAAVVLINLALWRILQQRWRAATAVLASLIMVTALANTGFKPPTNPTKQVGIVQLQDHTTDYIPFLTQRMQGRPPVDLLLLPEYSGFYTYEPGQQHAINQLAFGEKGGYAITSAPVNFEHKHLSEIQYHNQDSQLVFAQHKSFLIPVGEYLPYVHKTLLTFTAHPDEIDKYRQTRVQQKSAVPEEPVSIANTAIGTLSCSGVISPQLYQRLASHGTQLLVNVASLDIFQGSQLYFAQGRQMARFTAIANAKPFLQSSRGGYSYAIDANGKFAVETNASRVDYSTASVSPNAGKTPYTRWGEWSVPTAALGLLAYRFRKRLLKFK